MTSVSGSAEGACPGRAGLPPAQRRRHLLAVGLGNILEYYDFVVYGFLAVPIAHAFFPREDELTGLLAAFATFGVGFLARPVGGALLGWIGDRNGRTVALLAAVFGMAAGTVGIGLLPGYSSIGSLAPLLLVALRVVQGLSAGGGWGIATAFVVESAPARGRGLYGAVGQACITSSTLLGTILVAGVNAAFDPVQVERWAWRLPFLAGALILPLGLYLRRAVVEPPAFRQARTPAAAPPRTAGPAILMARAFGLTIVWTVSFYILLSYMPTFTATHAGLTPAQSLWSNAAALAVLIATIPAFGWLSDRIGRKPLLLASCAGLAALAYPLFRLMLDARSVSAILAAQVAFDLLLAAFSGAGPAALAEVFPTRSRTTSISISYSLATASFGGFAPFTATWLIRTTGSAASPALYVVAAAIVSGAVILRLDETAHEDLR